MLNKRFFGANVSRRPGVDHRFLEEGRRRTRGASAEVLEFERFDA
jgi:hypothetical protein